MPTIHSTITHYCPIPATRFARHHDNFQHHLAPVSISLALVSSSPSSRAPSRGPSRCGSMGRGHLATPASRLPPSSGNFSHWCFVHLIPCNVYPLSVPLSVSLSLSLCLCLSVSVSVSVSVSFSFSFSFSLPLSLHSLYIIMQYNLFFMYQE